MKLLAIANQKGGVGKTTTAVNLSTCLAAKGKRVLLIDLDPQGNATSALGLEGNAGQSLYEALIGHSNIKEKIVVTRFKGLSMIPADLDLAGAEIEVARLDDHLTRLREVLADLSREAGFDYLFLDCPPSLGILMTNALAAADPAFIPTDDCGVVLRYLPDTPVHVVPGSEDNIKVTHPADLEIAAALLRARQPVTPGPPA